MRTSRGRAFGALALALALGVGAAGACAGPQNYMRPSGPAADAEATLGWWLAGISAFVVLAVTVVLLVAVFRRRPDAADGRERPSARRALAVDDGGVAASGREAAAATGGPGGQADAKRHGGDKGLPWIYWGTAATIVVLIGAFVGTAVTLRAASRPGSPPALTIDVTGHMWWWEAQYRDSLPEHTFATANELHIPVGRPVRIRLRTADVIHSFWVPQLAGKTDLIPGQQNEMWFEAGRAGRFSGQCTEYCGMEHAKMALYVTAESPAEYERWAAGQRLSAPSLVPAAVTSAAAGRASQPVGEPMPATAPRPAVAGGAVAGAADSLALAGQAVFLANCGACHAVRGSDALGRVGPDLTHVASRATIAGGILPNTTGNLAGWVANAQGVKPGSRMPALPLPPGDLLAVVHYLQTLR